jgi:hypothetical protein
MLYTIVYQRTFEGAYWRTALSSISMGLLVLKVFTIEFYHISLVFFSFGVFMLFIAFLRMKGSSESKIFKVNNDIIILSFISSLVTFVVLVIQVIYI